MTRTIQLPDDSHTIHKGDFGKWIVESKRHFWTGKRVYTNRYYSVFSTYEEARAFINQRS